MLEGYHFDPTRLRFSELSEWYPKSEELLRTPNEKINFLTRTDNFRTTSEQTCHFLSASDNYRTTHITCEELFYMKDSSGTQYSQRNYCMSYTLMHWKNSVQTLRNRTKSTGILEFPYIRMRMNLIYTLYGVHITGFESFVKGYLCFLPLFFLVEPVIIAI